MFLQDPHNMAAHANGRLKALFTLP